MCQWYMSVFLDQCRIPLASTRRPPQSRARVLCLCHIECYGPNDRAWRKPMTSMAFFYFLLRTTFDHHLFLSNSSRSVTYITDALALSFLSLFPPPSLLSFALASTAPLSSSAFNVHATRAFYLILPDAYISVPRRNRPPTQTC